MVFAMYVKYSRMKNSIGSQRDAKAWASKSDDCDRIESVVLG